MKKKGLFSIILLIAIVFSSLTGLKAQDVLNGIYVKQHVPNRKPVPYQYLREADVMWSKTIWREMELSEKMNFPFYYPEQPVGDRMSLISLLMWGIQNQGLTAYNYDMASGEEFATVMTVKDIEDKFGAKDQVIMVENVEDPEGPMIERTIEGEISLKEVKRFLIKEMWFFDKQRSVLEVRIIGLCPIRMYTKDSDDPDAEEDEELQKKMLFWVYFPEARKILANHEVFNPKNDSKNMSFDDVFFKRFFSSHIVQESNAYNNRAIIDYTVGLETMLEAERIKEGIFNYEQDLWEY